MKIIVITGYLASGKSTFALNLSERLNIPCFIKDNFKSALCQGLTLTSRAEKSAFSAITFDGMMYVAERLMERGCPLILEGNFQPAGVKPVDEAGEIQSLIEKHGYDALTFRFCGDTDVLHRRFVLRESSAERGAANQLGMAVSPEQFGQWCRNMDGFSVGGRIIDVDTTDFCAVNFEGLIREAAAFLK